MVIFFHVTSGVQWTYDVVGSRKQTEYEWSRLVARVDLIAMNCQGWITGLLLSQLARVFIPFDTQPELSLDNIMMVTTTYGDAVINHRQSNDKYKGLEFPGGIYNFLCITFL